MEIKLFKTLLIVIPCLLIATLCIVAVIPKNKNTIVIDEEGDLSAFDGTEYTTNSQMGFFYKRDQLSTYRKQQIPDKVKNISVTEGIVTTDFNKNHTTVLPDIRTDYTGPRNVVLYNGEVSEFIGVTDSKYILKGGAQVPQEDTFNILLSHSVLGHSGATPYRIKKGNTYYAAFTQKLESIYFEFESTNEFLSVVVGGLSGRVEYELYDSSMNTVLTDWNHSKESIEIKYKGRGSAKYYLRITGSYQDMLKPFSIRLSSDDNEWLWQMLYPELGQQTKSRFDYYGDDDYFVLPKSITDNINKSVMRFTSASHDINVVIYDKNKKLLGQYVYNAAKPEAISMYGLDGAYAMSIYSYSGENSGSEYSFILEHTNITVLDIETLGFQLTPGFTESNDYYTVYTDSLENKKITDVMYSPKEASVSIKVTQQSGYSYTAKLGDTLKLMPGRNTVELNVKISGVTRTITIMIADKSHDVSYGILKKTVSDGTQGLTIEKGDKVLIIRREQDVCKVQVIPLDRKGFNASNVGKIMSVSYGDIYDGYEQTNMPGRYATKINELKAKYPNWEFEFVKVGTTLDAYANSQYGESSRLDNTGAYASINQIKTAIDPRNFLDEKNIFMFEDATYSTKIQYKDAGIKSIWNDNTIANYMQRAGEVSGISPYFITARAALESGYGKSALAMGTVTGYTGYYNFFGIGANDNDAANKGGQMAKNMNWNTKLKALIGGAIWIDTNYISNLQPTIYFMKYNPYLSWHQYMTDINAPKKDAERLYNANAAAGTLSSYHKFIIPVYD